MIAGKVKWVDDWGHITVFAGKHKLEPWKGIRPVFILWKDLTETQENVAWVKYVQQVSDHGQSYAVVSQVPVIRLQVHGESVEVPLDKRFAVRLEFPKI